MQQDGHLTLLIGQDPAVNWCGRRLADGKLARVFVTLLSKRCNRIELAKELNTTAGAVAVHLSQLEKRMRSFDLPYDLVRIRKANGKATYFIERRLS